ncbi:MAG TPA: WD40 repeat domain-containing protein, partial [Gemmataceae bacterium]|nr:WD40 repeat domain-containing protein [Gemmataceae bacterium]
MLSRVVLGFLLSALCVTALRGQPAETGSRVPTNTDAQGDPLPEGAIARLGSLRFKHAPGGDPTIDVAMFAPDGNVIASLVYGQGSIRLWNASDGKEIPGPWSKSMQRFTAMTFSPDGTVLAAAANPGPGPVKEKDGP